MQKLNKSSRQILRYYISEKEIKNPNLIISDFFIQGLLSEHLKMLKSWRTAVLSNHYYKDDNFPGNLVCEHRLFVKLLGAAWLLRNDRRRSELLKDGVNLKKLFGTFKLKRYHRILNHWLIAGLSGYRADDTLKNEEIVLVYKNLKRLCKFCYVINEQENKAVYKN